MNSLCQRDVEPSLGLIAAILRIIRPPVPVGATAASILFGQPIGSGFMGVHSPIVTTGGTLTLLHTYTITFFYDNADC